jgi:hypothetical protein
VGRRQAVLQRGGAAAGEGFAVPGAGTLNGASCLVGMDGVGSEDEEGEEVRWVLPPLPLVLLTGAMQMRGGRREIWRQCGLRVLVGGKFAAAASWNLEGGGGGGPLEGGREGAGRV